MRIESYYTTDTNQMRAGVLPQINMTSSSGNNGTNVLTPD